MLATRAAHSGPIRPGASFVLREGGGDYYPLRRPYEISTHTRARVDDTHEEIALQEAMRQRRLAEQMGELQRASDDMVRGTRIITAPQLLHIPGQTAQSFRPIGGFPFVRTILPPEARGWFQRSREPGHFAGYGAERPNPWEMRIARRGPDDSLDLH